MLDIKGRKKEKRDVQGGIQKGKEGRKVRIRKRKCGRKRREKNEREK